MPYTASVKRLIVNADDLGLTASVNRGIVEAHRAGIVTSATLMANGAAYDDAVSLVSGESRLGIGCHVDLVQLSPTLSPAQVPSLCENGHFRHGLAALAARSVLGRIDPGEVASEVAAQIRKLQSSGIKVSHLDTHKHAHVFPAILSPLLRAARDCGVRAIRNPFEPGAANRLLDVAARPGLVKRWAAVRILSSMAPQFRRKVRQEGLFTTDGTVGIVFTGSLTQERLCELLRNVPDGCWELVMHPGYNDSVLPALSRLTSEREWELALLVSSQTRKAVANAGIELITYADLGG